MKPLIVLILFFQVPIYSKGQQIDWSKTQHWRIYALNNQEAYYYSADTLPNIKSVPMDDSTVISFLSKGVLWPKGKRGTWMGLFIASYETVDRQLKKVVISSYGGFLFESASCRYYELPKEIRGRWNDFVNQHLQKVFEE